MATQSNEEEEKADVEMATESNREHPKDDPKEDESLDAKEEQEREKQEEKEGKVDDTDDKAEDKEGKPNDAEGKEEKEESNNEEEDGQSFEKSTAKGLWSVLGMMRDPDKVLESDTFDYFRGLLSTTLEYFEKTRSIADTADKDGLFPVLPKYFVPHIEKYQLQVASAPFQEKVLICMCVFLHSLEHDCRKTERERTIAELEGESRARDFQSLKARTWNLLYTVSPSVGALLCAHLDKENDWVVWKKGNCNSGIDSRKVTLPEPPAKRQCFGIDYEPEAASTYVKSLLDMLADKNEAEDHCLPAFGNAQIDQKAACHAFAEKLWNEDNPEEQIEEEYKMKNDKVFTWQARRLMCQNHLVKFSEQGLGPGSAKYPNCDFMDLVDKVLGRTKEAASVANGVKETPSSPEK